MRILPDKPMQRADRSETQRTRKRGLARRCAVLALLPLLSGCVAAAIAVPAMTVAGALTKRTYLPAPAEAQTPTAPASAAAPENVLTAPASPAGASGTAIEVTTLTALPPPTPADFAQDPWRGFVAYALGQAAALGKPGAGTAPAESAILAREGIANLTAQRRPCGGIEPAVILDLDQGAAVFAPEGAGAPSPGLVEGLARLRAAGIVVLWISGADANRVDEVADALRRTGLDPEARDPLLLRLNEDARKQTMREEANENVCVLAIAGDQRADFDELFEYLRTPDAAVGLEAMIGFGWFITPVPLPFAPAGAEQGQP